MFLQSSTSSLAPFHPSSIAPVPSPSSSRKSSALRDPDQNRGGSQCLTKGLRHFSLRVCKKVEEKGVTTYNEVADELVADLGGGDHQGDQKNIRRRVYDALNVLMAMNIIYKNRKEISWVGLPSSLLHDYESLLAERSSLEEKILQKRKHVQDLVARHTAMKNLILRNKNSEEINGEPPSAVILHLPFILINAPKDTRINCEMLEDRTHFYFDFDASFSIHEDLELLRLMGLCGEASQVFDPISSLSSALIGYLGDDHHTRTIRSSSEQFLGSLENNP